MDIINGLHGLGVGLLAIATSVALISIFGALATPEEASPHSFGIIVAALTLAVVAGFLIGATS